MASPQSEAVQVELPTTVEIDRRRLVQLEGQRAELYATQRVLAVVAERLLAVTSGDVLIIEKAAFEDAPDLYAMRDRDIGEVTVMVSRTPVTPADPPAPAPEVAP